MRSDHDDAIGRAIEEAARSLTSAEPSTALRARVRGRIERDAGVASAVRRKAWWLVPAGAVAAVIAVMIVGRALSGPAVSGGPVRSTGIRATDVRLAPALVTAPPTAVPGPAHDVQPAVTVTTVPLEDRLTATFEPPAEEPEPVIQPITIPALETKQIAVDTSSGVMPIEIVPLRIEPLQGE